MASSSKDAAFIVWGIDQIPYGPVELAALIAWVRDERITADTWIFAAKERVWQRAAALPELAAFFSRATSNASPSPHPVLPAVDLQSLRRISVLAWLSDEQLERFAQFLEVISVPAGTLIAKQGEMDDTMYLLLEGKLSFCTTILGKKTTVATLGGGEFFGDISLFNHGPRAADVVAANESVLVSISSDAFERMAHEAPDVATPFLLAIGKSLSARIRDGEKAEAVRPSTPSK